VENVKIDLRFLLKLGPTAQTTMITEPAVIGNKCSTVLKEHNYDKQLDIGDGN
jgi:hypothetical protein